MRALTVRHMCGVVAMVLGGSGIATDSYAGENPGSSQAHNIAPGGEAGFVGDKACETCHPSIYGSFKRSEMGRSFYLPSEADVIEDYSDSVRVYDSNSDFYYVPYRRRGDYYQRELRLDANGEVVHELEYRVDFIVGSGNHNRTYISARNGALFELPLTWYTDQGIWDLSPGYDEQNLRFSRPIVPECMNCHNSFAGHRPFSQSHYTRIPNGIGCERCHGPGREHVSAYEEGPGEEEGVGDGSIVNPGNLPLDRQVDVCLQCHLQGTVSVLRAGRTETDFRPGMRLADVRSIYMLASDTSGDFGIASHGERMLMSRCYKASDGAMVCTTCHDPHKPLKQTDWEDYNSACLSCHASDALAARVADHESDADCAKCHMRQGETSNIIHVNFTDHWIRTKPETTTASFEEARDRNRGRIVELESFFKELDVSAPIREGIAYVKYFEAKHSHPTYLKRAITNLEAGLERDPGHADGHYFLGLAYRHAGRLEDSVDRLNRSLEMKPRDGRSSHQLGRVLQELGRSKDAVAAYKASLNTYPDNAVAFNNLGNVYAALGQSELAVAAYKEAIRSQADYAPAYNNLGDHYAFKLQDLESGTAYFEAALKYDPDFVMALHNLGTVELAQGRTSDAKRRFERALRINPRFVPALGNLALIHLDQGNVDEAEAIVGRILEINPEDPRARELAGRIEEEKAANQKIGK